MMNEALKRPAQDRNAQTIRRHAISCLTAFLAFLLPAMLLVAGTQTATAQANAQGQFLVAATLSKSLDSKKAKEGDPVEGKVAGTVKLKDGTVIPRGAKVIGHISQAKAKSKGDPESALGITFDKIEIPGGNTIAIAGQVRAVGANPSEGESGGGVGYGGLNQTVEHAQTGDQSQPVQLLTDQSEGVFGIKNLNLNDGVMKTDGKVVKLEYGSQLLIRAQPAGAK